jgi:hypothetical protein
MHGWVKIAALRAVCQAWSMGRAGADGHEVELPLAAVTIELEYADDEEEMFGEGRNPDVIWALRGGERIGYVQFYIFNSLSELEEEIEPGRYGWKVEGPFFRPDEQDGAILYFADIMIQPEHRASGVYERLVQEVEATGFPVYACFTNSRLAERWRHRHRP